MNELKLNEILEKLSWDTEFARTFLMPDAATINHYFDDLGVDINDEDEVEKVTLQTIVWDLRADKTVYAPANHLTIDEGGTDLEHVYLKSFTKDYDGAHFKFDRVSPVKWTVTMTTPDGIATTQTAYFLALNSVLEDAYLADDFIFEDFPLEGDEWRLR